MAKEILYYFLARFSTIVASFFLVKLCTTSLSAEQYGYFELLLLTAQLLSMGFAMGIGSAINREVHHSQRDSKQVLSTSMLFYLLLSVPLVFFSYLMGSFFISDTITLSLVLGIALVLGMVEIMIGFLRSQSRSFRYFTFTLIQSLLYIGSLLYCFTVIVEPAVELILAVYLASLLVLFICYFLSFRSYIVFTLDTALLRSLLFYGVPIFLSGLAAFVYNSMDRYLLYFFLSFEQVALYVVAYKVASLLSFFTASVQMAWPKYMFLIDKDGEKKVRYDEVLRWYSLILLLGVLILSVIAEPLIRLISDAAYSSVSNLVGIIAFSLVFSGLSHMMAQGIHVSGKSYLQLLATFSGAILNLLLNLYFIPRYGLIAAALSTAASMIVMWLVLTKLSLSLRRVQYSWGRLLTAFSLAGAFLCFLFYSNSLFYISFFALCLFAFFPFLLLRKGEFDRLRALFLESKR